MTTQLKYCLCLLAVLIWGCGAEIGGEGQSQYAPMAVTETTDGGVTAVDNMTGQNVSYWARRLVFSGFAETPLGPQLSHIIAIARITLEETEDGWVASEHTCYTGIERPEFPDLITEIPDAFLQSMAITRRPVIRDNDSIVFTRSIELQGVRLVDPSNDVLPTDEADPRIIDQDNDGNPGVTVEMNGLIRGSLYLIQRIISRLSGTLSEDRMEGLADWSSEEVVIAASNPLLKVSTKITPHMDPQQSNFLARKISADQTCDDIVLAAPTLFEGQTP